MSFLDNCVKIIEIIGNSLSNFVDFIINLPKLVNNIISVMPNPLFGIATIFISFIIIIVLARVVRLFVG